MVQHSNPEVRRIAAQTFKDYPASPDIIEALAEALSDQDKMVRFWSVETLRKIGDSRAIEPLIAVLNDREFMIRKRTVTALGEIGDNRAVEALIQTWNNDPPDEYEDIPALAAGALGKIGDSRAVEPLMANIVNRCRMCRTYAAVALGCLGDLRAVEPLIEVLYDFDNRSCWLVAEALGRLGDERAVEALKAALFWADSAVANFSEDEEDEEESGRLASYSLLVYRSKEALEQIGTPEALAAIDDLPFRDLGE